MSDETLLEKQQVRLESLWNQMVHTLGIHTVRVLLDRAIWQASQEHPGLSNLRYTDQGFTFTSVANLPPRELEQAVNALHDEMLLIMARLLGQDMAKRLLDEMDSRAAGDSVARGDH
ncbi:MAG: hypothetical protein MUD01_01990 [Chloroflexaceae bacterium]|jgi:hypothetical protein|nr:hypothetical protein [Chloroflexaceae bacterium]